MSASFYILIKLNTLHDNTCPLFSLEQKIKNHFEKPYSGPFIINFYHVNFTLMCFYYHHYRMLNADVILCCVPTQWICTVMFLYALFSVLFSIFTKNTIRRTCLNIDFSVSEGKSNFEKKYLHLFERDILLNNWEYCSSFQFLCKLKKKKFIALTLKRRVSRGLFLLEPKIRFCNSCWWIVLSFLVGEVWMNFWFR